MRSALSLRSASSELLPAAAAVAEVADRLDPHADLYLAFVPDRYDLTEAAEALTAWAGPRIVACTSAGGIGPDGYVRDGLVAVSLTGPELRCRTLPITPLNDLPTAWALTSGSLAAARDECDGIPAFAVLLVDGLSRAEEEVVDGLLDQLGRDIPVIGGSAGDDLRFTNAKVLLDGQFVAGAGTLTVVSTSAPFRPFRIQHHVAGEALLVVTDATPEERLVHTLNGRPAVEEYARAVGIEPGLLEPTAFSRHPLVLRAGGGEWVRSISRVEPDGSLRFFCAAERGAVLRLGTSMSPTHAIEAAFEDLRGELGELAGALVFDCILRRLEFEQKDMADDVAKLLARFGAVGFSTFGEQFGGVHVNQTMVGIAFGG